MSNPELIWKSALRPEDGAQAVKDLFECHFGAAPAGIYRAPGRVNIIGEHTDYNGGLVLPIALPHATYVAAAPRADRRLRLASAQIDEVLEIDLDEVGPAGQAGALGNWGAYVAGVLLALEEILPDLSDTPLPGLDLVVDSCVPFGAGLSSSAALECAVAVAIDDLANLGLAGGDEGRKVLVEASIRAENRYAGANTGGMDQAASMRAQAGHALLLDCISAQVRQVPFDLAAAGLELLVIDTRAPHQLVDGQYAARRAGCEAAAATLGVDFLARLAHIPPGLVSGGEAGDGGNLAADWSCQAAVEADLPQILARLEGEQVQLTRHVLTEIARTVDFVRLMDRADLGQEVVQAEIGRLLSASHASLRDDYRVTCPQLDLTVDVALEQGARGARMTGGGFGGSAIALVEAGSSAQYAAAIDEAFRRAGYVQPHFILAVPGSPAGKVH